MKIYCDESGYTGSDLLEKNQPYFVYSAVNFSEKQLTEIKEYIYKNYNVQNNEIKGKLLVNNTKGQKVIKEIFKKYSKNARIVYHDKKYALSAKIVEYGIEPYLRSNFQFYKSNLNDFIATGLYASFILKEDSAEKLFQDFLLILRGKKEIDSNLLISLKNDNPLFEWLLEIITTKPSIILDEIQIADSEIDKWILDLTMTSLLGLLSDWSKNGAELDVVCDNSKVFINNPIFEIINKMGLIGNRKKILETPLGFKLKNIITIDDSKDNFGIQMADLFSSTIYYCLNNRETEFSKFILDIFVKDCLCTPASFCVLPKLTGSEKEFPHKKEYYYEFMNMIYLDVKARFIE